LDYGAGDGVVVRRIEVEAVGVGVGGVVDEGVGRGGREVEAVVRVGVGGVVDEGVGGRGVIEVEAVVRVGVGGVVDEGVGRGGREVEAVVRVGVGGVVDEGVVVSSSCQMKTNS